MIKYIPVALSCVLSLTSYAENFEIKGHLYNQNKNDDIVFVASPIVLNMPSNTVEIGANQRIPFDIKLEKEHDTIFTFQATKKSTSEVLGTCHFVVSNVLIGVASPIIDISSSGKVECHTQWDQNNTYMFMLKVKT